MLELAIFMYLVGLMSFLKNCFYLMMMLLSFEFMYLSMFMLINCMILMDTYLLTLVYLTLIVAEASLGLSLMVIMSFFYGNDQVSSMFMLKC
uniref:NADH dehydrogenase subunit 4L n=1 Tax=Ixodes pavlovskyi TaxID=79495 RepID=W8SIJ5_9ACAR|nr:NADH dehydrogenase subunit 4L [Ixodes pavlovskyi]AHM02281.1 NADH dehydrogenase subunit 4L [Ixodes pavlovskyi]